MCRQLELFIGRVDRLKKSELNRKVLSENFKFEFRWRAGSKPILKRPKFHPDLLTAFLTLCRPLISDTDGISCRQIGELLADSPAPNKVKKAWNHGRVYLTEYLDAPTRVHVETDPSSNRDLIFIFNYGEHIHLGRDEKDYRRKFEKFSKDAIAEAMMESELLGVLANTLMFLGQFQALAQQALDGFAAESKPA